MNLGFGFSPCPNDTFSFDALVHGRIEAPFAATAAFHDIEELNALARERPVSNSRSSRSAPSPGSATATRCCAAAPRSGAAAGRS